MKVGEARKLYSSQIRSYNMEKFKLGKEKTALEEKIKKTENGQIIYANEAATLELTYNAVAEKQKEYQDYMSQLMEQWQGKFDQVAAKENAEAEKEYFEDVGKILTVARRMMQGHTVPGSDEKKLMEYDDDLYKMAKNAQMMAQIREKKKYESLWEDEEERQREDAMEAADGQEAFASGPEVVNVQDTVAAAQASADVGQVADEQE
ncbi:MAG: hypothetical protein K6G62_08450 [Eubacterium sp.]|nr:hypothetical protein [Eubacterium sp.]